MTFTFNRITQIIRYCKTTSKHFTTQITDNYSSSISHEELERFSKLASEWWNYNGPFKPLHSMNLLRCNFIRESTCNYFNIDKNKLKPFENIKILDIGCGGGILSEPLCRLGANVLGIDLVPDSIHVARQHASKYPEFKDKLKYELISAESLLVQNKAKQEFDVVVASEVIEHVDNVVSFMETMSSLIKKDGMLIVSTINRTLLSYFLVIIFCENIANLVPKNTHQWKKFITPDELALISKREDLKMYHLSGMLYNPINNKWDYQRNTSMNYIASFVKK